MYDGTCARSRRPTCCEVGSPPRLWREGHEQRHRGDADDHGPARRHAVAARRAARAGDARSRGWPAWPRRDEPRRAARLAPATARPAATARRRSAPPATRRGAPPRSRPARATRSARAPGDGRGKEDRPARSGQVRCQQRQQRQAPGRLTPPARRAVAEGGQRRRRGRRGHRAPAICTDVRSRMPASQSATSAVRRACTSRRRASRNWSGGGLTRAFPDGGRRDLDVGGLRGCREALVDVHLHAQVVGHPLTGVLFGEAEGLRGRA